MAPLASASDLRGTDLGDGSVELTWTYPEDIAARGIVFDVYGADTPERIFQTLRAEGVAAIRATITGFQRAGAFTFALIARRGEQLSLPSSPLRLQVSGSAVSTAVVSASLPATARGGGLGFPFGITAGGGVFAQGGDPLLRGKILQLLLTSPGERVNRPDYGTRLMDLVFDPSSDVLAATTELMVTRALQRHFADEIAVEKVHIAVDDATLTVDIVYLKKTDLRLERVRLGVPLPAGALA